MLLSQLYETEKRTSIPASAKIDEGWVEEHIM